MATKNFNLAKLARNINIEDDGSIAFTSEVSAGGETIGSLTASMDSDQTSTITLSKASTPVPIVQAYKEIPQTGISSKGQWNVNANATNYDFFDEKPISYASTTLTPSATGDGTFTSNSSIIGPTEISNLTYDNKSINITSLNHTGSGSYSDLRGLHIKPDGTKLFSLSNAGIVSEHVLSTAYDISTTTYNNIDTSVLTAQSSQVFDRDLFLSPDGTKLFVLEATTKEIARYDLSTAWDLSTLNTTKHSYYIETANYNSPYSFTFVPDGTGLIIFYNSVNYIIKYDLSTAWDLSTASRANFTIAPNSSSSNAYVGSTADIDLHSLEFADNGNVLIGSDYAQQKIYQWDLTSQYSITSSTSLAYDTQFGITLLAGNNVSYGPGPLQILNGKSYIVDGGTKSIIYQYTSSALSAFNAADVGKKVVGNSGSAIITATSGTYTSVTPFADTSAISSWQLFGAEGKSDGSGIQLTSIGGGYDFSNLSYAGRSFYLTGAVATLTGGQGMAMKPDGTKMWVIDKSSDKIVEFSLSTPYEIDTASSTGTELNILSYESAGLGIHVNSEGTRLIIIGSNQDEWNEFHLSTGWDLTTATHDQVTSIASITSGVSAPQDLVFNDDGTRMFIIGANVDKILGYTLSTAFDISTLTSAGELSTALIDGTPGSLSINNDGTELYISGTQYDNLLMLKLDTAYDLSSYNASASLTYSWTSDGSGIGTNAVEGITISKSGTKMYLTASNGYIYEYDFGDTGASNFNSYSPALTKSSTGQINSSTWTDINSMTADETKNGGDIFYAVSTDNRTSWGVAKASDGVRKIVKNNSGTWQYNNNGGTLTSVSSLADAEYSSQFSIATASNKLRDIIFNSDGTKMYLLWFSSEVRQFSLSTAYDISTAVYDSVSLTTNNEETLQTGMKWNNDGTKLYIVGYSNDKVHEYILTTAYDLSTASYNNVFFSVSSQMATPFGLTFKPDGTKMYVTDNGGNIYQYSLSTAWDMSSAAYDNISFSIGVLSEGFIFNSLGTKLYYVNSNILYRWTLSTAWDLSTLASESSLDFDSDLPSNGISTGLAFNGDESNIYVTWRNADGVATINLSVLGYSTSETWVNGTNNNEHATLQQALGAQSFNRMNKAQLDAVADAYHFSQDSADTLDLMIAPYAASGASPISDGVTINYDAASKYRQAVPETDYRVDFQGTTTVEFTSNISANFKVKVV